MATGYYGGAPTGASAADQQGSPTAGSFIGVPDGYSVAPSLGDWFRPEQQIIGPQGQLLGAADRQPQYPDGYEDRLFDMTPEEIARLQAKLASAGLIGASTKFRVGIVTGTSDPTYSAFKKALGTANRYGVNVDDAVNFLAANPEVRGDGTPVDATGGPSRSVNKTISDPVLTDPLTARATLRSTLEDRLGRAPTSDEYHQFRTLLSNAEGGQDVTTTISTTDGEGHSKTRVKRSDPTSDPSAATVADDFSRKGALGKEANTRTAGVDYYDAIASLIGG